LLLAQIGADQVLILQQFLCSTVGLDGTQFQNVGVVGNHQRLTGILLPVLIYLGGSSRWGRFGGAAAGTAMLACNLEGSMTPRIWSLLALAPLALYNGEPGKHKLKYFFYVFYPAHLVLLYGIDIMLAWLGR
ncbi:MAG: hypothetical protein II330_08615, partial [Clostridia bacterium]|nr:hypothetical protein [Clostridia bacterium]